MFLAFPVFNSFNLLVLLSVQMEGHDKHGSPGNKATSAPVCQCLLHFCVQYLCSTCTTSNLPVWRHYLSNIVKQEITAYKKNLIYKVWVDICVYITRYWLTVCMCVWLCITWWRLPKSSQNVVYIKFCSLVKVWNNSNAMACNGLGLLYSAVYPWKDRGDRLLNCPECGPL